MTPGVVWVGVDVTILEPSGDDFGLWCPDCLRSSGVWFPYVLTLRSDPSRVMGRGHIRRCVDCGGGCTPHRSFEDVLRHFGLTEADLAAPDGPDPGA